MTNARYSNVSPKRPPTRGQTVTPTAKMRPEKVQRFLPELLAPSSASPSDHPSQKTPKLLHRAAALERHNCRTAYRNLTNQPLAERDTDHYYNTGDLYLSNCDSNIEQDLPEVKEYY
jgi:hypothetical protein